MQSGSDIHNFHNFTDNLQLLKWEILLCFSRFKLFLTTLSYCAGKLGSRELQRKEIRIAAFKVENDQAAGDVENPDRYKEAVNCEEYCLQQ